MDGYHEGDPNTIGERYIEWKKKNFRSANENPTKEEVQKITAIAAKNTENLFARNR